jgi:hypothetical protein
MNELIANPQAFFSELGGLHDADITRATWSPAARCLTLDVDDLNANFFGLPEYSGKRPMRLIFNEAQKLALECDGLPGDTQRVYRLEVGRNERAGHFNLLVLISPSGRLGCEFETMELRDALP